LDRARSLASSYPAYAFVDATPYGYPGMMALVSNITAVGSVTLVVKDHFQALQPQVRLESARVDCITNDTTVQVVNSGIAGDTLAGITYLDGSYVLSDFWANRGVSTFTTHSRLVSKICINVACIELASAAICRESVGGFFMSTSANVSMASSSSDPTMSNTIIYVIVGVSGFVALAVLAAVVACVVMYRRRHHRGWTRAGVDSQSSVPLTSPTTWAATNNSI
jgi:hypothetical protein